MGHVRGPSLPKFGSLGSVVFTSRAEKDPFEEMQEPQAFEKEARKQERLRAPDLRRGFARELQEHLANLERKIGELEGNEN